MKAFEVKDGFDAVFCETEQEAKLVAEEFMRWARVIGAGFEVEIVPVEVIDIPENERRFVARIVEQFGQED